MVYSRHIARHLFPLMESVAASASGGWISSMPKHRFGKAGIERLNRLFSFLSLLKEENLSPD
jgi:hypothetical protein